MPLERQDRDTLKSRLDELLDPVLSTRRTASEPAEALAQLERTTQDFVLHWLGVITRTNSEMGYQFVSRAAIAARELDLNAMERWIIQAMDVYDREGLYAGTAALDDIARFAHESAVQGVIVHLEEVRGVLENYLTGLSGRPLRIDSAPVVFTDTQTVYLPEAIDILPTREQNFTLYKAMASHLWAQTWFGTFRRKDPDAERLSEKLSHFPDPALASEAFYLLETCRLDACIERTLPGLSRSMKTLYPAPDDESMNPRWREAIARVCRSGTTVETVVDAMGDLGASELPRGLRRPYQGTLRFASVDAAIDERTRQEAMRLTTEIQALVNEQNKAPDTRFELQIVSDASDEGPHVELVVDGEAVTPSPAMDRLMQSIGQDLEEIPPHYLIATGEASSDMIAESDQSLSNAPISTHREQEATRYDEWDFRRRHYRKDWCVLRELDMRPVDEPFVDMTLSKYRPLVNELRRSFEALRGEHRRLKRQPSGDDVDLDALVEGIAETRSGREAGDRVYSRWERLERDIAVAFMVDVSGSTKGWINDAERESLVLLCEALEVLGDRYAIYGFSGMTRKRCEVYRIKRFEEPYSDLVRGRIAGIKPRDYTRMGVTIRHLTHIIGQIDARTRVLITLSDGKPDDYDGYRGEYGIEDTRQALIEAKHAGIHPFCITIDRSAMDYLPHMYGAVNYTVVEDVRKLPARVSDIYRRLTR